MEDNKLDMKNDSEDKNPYQNNDYKWILWIILN